MAEFNMVILVGNLTKDPEKVQYAGTTTIANFRLAANRTYKDSQSTKQNDVVFVDVKAFGKIADRILKYCQKGRQILVQGRLSMDEWVDKTSGGKRSKLYIIAENFQFLGLKEQNGNDNGQSTKVIATAVPEKEMSVEDVSMEGLNF